jgi:hypothetical protein
MPELTKILGSDDLTRALRITALDLTPYMDIIDAIREQGGAGAEVRLSTGEQRRTEKRRLSMAAKERGYQLVWRTAPTDRLKFVLATPGEPAPGGRRRRTPAEQEEEQTVIDAVMTPDVAEVTETVAPVDESIPAPARRGRRKAE